MIKSESTVLLGFCVSKRPWCRGRRS